MYRITIRDMVFLGCHGVNPEEKVRKQRFGVTVDLGIAHAVAGDDIHATVNWSAVRKGIRDAVEGASVNLVESLVERIGGVVLDYPSVASVIVQVTKPDAWSDRNGLPSITMTFTKPTE